MWESLRSDKSGSATMPLSVGVEAAGRVIDGVVCEQINELRPLSLPNLQ